MNFLNNKSIQLKRISKLLQLLLFFLAIAISTTSMAQTKKDSTKTEKKPVQKDNFLDMGSGTLGQIFGENLDGKSKNKKLSFLELLEKMDMPANQKAEYKNWYFLQAKDLTEKQKDSLGKAIEKKIMEAKRDN
ncbi:hypothetical protein [Mariniflexile sp.]|uniref:hypothetical protein n=1 Tax=Mariniflexile sp. TaxID=1979402 RepID=UPI00404733AF